MVESHDGGEDHALDDENSRAEGIDYTVPSELCARGQTVWGRVVPDLVRAGRLKPTDREALTRYCDLVAQYWGMSDKIRTEGETILTPTIAKDGDGKAGSMWRRHPLLSERRAVAQSLKDLEDRFGMTPLSRANLVAKLAGGAGSGSSFLPGMGDEDGEDGLHADPAQFN